MQLVGLVLAVRIRYRTFRCFLLRSCTSIFRLLVLACRIPCRIFRYSLLRSYTSMHLLGLVLADRIPYRTFRYWLLHSCTASRLPEQLAAAFPASAGSRPYPHGLPHRHGCSHRCCTRCSRATPPASRGPWYRRARSAPRRR